MKPPLIQTPSTKYAYLRIYIYFLFPCYDSRMYSIFFYLGLSILVLLYLINKSDNSNKKYNYLNKLMINKYDNFYKSLNFNICLGSI